MPQQQLHTSEHVRFSDELFAISREETFRDPMLDAVRSGAMSREQLKLWMMQAMQVVRQFTRFISAIHANCPHRDAQQLLAENLWEEHGRGVAHRDHYRLIRKLIASLGGTDDEMDRVQPLPETTDYIDFCFLVTRERSFIEGMTAVGIGIESFIPVFFRALAQNLSERYGLSLDDLEYLLVHVGEDEDHARRSMEMIDRYADSEALKESARESLREMLKMKRRFAQAVFKNCECQ